MNVHVVKIVNGAVYGHSDARCDSGGCGIGTEFIFHEIDANDVQVGDLVELVSDPLAWDDTPRPDPWGEENGGVV